MNCLQQRFAIQFCGMGILPVPVLLAGKMPAPQEILDISLIGSLLVHGGGLCLCGSVIYNRQGLLSSSTTETRGTATGRTATTTKTTTRIAAGRARVTRRFKGTTTKTRTGRSSTCCSPGCTS